MKTKSIKTSSKLVPFHILKSQSIFKSVQSDLHLSVLVLYISKIKVDSHDPFLDPIILLALFLFIEMLIHVSNVFEL